MHSGPDNQEEFSQQDTGGDASAGILRGFSGALSKTGGVSFGYRAAMCAVAVMMVLLPLVYLAIIAAVGWGVVWYALHGVVILENMRGWGALVIYFGPLVAGAVLIIVMCSPLFSAPKRGPEPLFVSREKEPALWALVERICREVHAARPRHIAVNCVVNASASFEPGPLGFLLGRLRLTVGLPLARGMTMEQFAGVLAHEFGHFAQGGGMRFSYIIRSMNNWFARVIYERSELERSAAKLGNIGVLSQVMMQGARLVLRGLMRFGNLVSAHLLRQMEFDADARMARVVGSATLESAMIRLGQLDAGSQRAWQIVNEFARSNRLPADVNVLIADSSRHLPGHTRSRLAAALDNEQQGRFDTHPTARARIAAARLLNEPGIFHDSENAAKIFADADALAREATRHHYSLLPGVNMTKITLVERDEVSQRDQSRAAGQEAAAALFEGLPLQYLKLQVDENDITAKAPPQSGENASAALEKSATELRAAREKLSEQIAAARPAIVRWDKAMESWRQQLLANLLYDAGFVSQARQVKGASNLKKRIDPINELERRAAEIDAAIAELQPRAPAVSAFFTAAAIRRLHEAAGQTAGPGETAQTKARDAVLNRVKVLRALCATSPDHRKMEEVVAAMPALLRLFSAKGEITRDDLNVAQITVNLGVTAGSRCAKTFTDMLCPFEEMPEGSTMSNYLLTAKNPKVHALVSNTHLVTHLHSRMNEAAQRIAGWFAMTGGGD